MVDFGKWLRHGTIVVTYAAAICVTGCDKPPTLGANSMQMKTLTHADGWTVALPATGWVSETTGEGFTFRPEGDTTRRFSRAITIKRSSANEPAGHFPETKQLTSGVARYRIDTVEGGSGGAEKYLVAWKPCGAGTMEIEQGQQSEGPAQPDFDIAWAVLDSIACT
jgi:hypothetical protein